MSVWLIVVWEELELLLCPLTLLLVETVQFNTVFELKIEPEGVLIDGSYKILEPLQISGNWLFGREGVGFTTTAIWNGIPLHCGWEVVGPIGVTV